MRSRRKRKSERSDRINRIEDWIYRIFSRFGQVDQFVPDLFGKTGKLRGVKARSEQKPTPYAGAQCVLSRSKVVADVSIDREQFEHTIPSVHRNDR